jgi:serine/threonine protein kinase
MGNCCSDCFTDLKGSCHSDYQPIPDHIHEDDSKKERAVASKHPKKLRSKQQAYSESVLVPITTDSQSIQPYAALLPDLPPEFHKLYEVGKQLGVGTTSKVFEVKRKKRHSTKNGVIRDLACKIIDKRKLTLGMDRSDVEPLLAQLRKEVDILRRVHHPNIVSYVDFLESRDKIIIITERLEGGELFDYILNHGPLPESKARQALHGVFCAVAYLHDRGVVHRDIKAENLIFFQDVNDEQSLKMIDFGFSTILKHDQTGSFLGTGGYIAPEIRQNKSYSTSVDNWALGVLMYCTLSAKLPFTVSIDALPSTNAQCRQAFVLRFPPKPWAGVSQIAKDLITGLLEIDTFKRTTAKEALQHPWVSPAVWPIARLG